MSGPSAKAPLLPPRGVFTVTSLIFDARLPASVKETLLQLLALAWSSPSHETGPLSYEQLSELTGKSHTTLYGHLTALRAYRSALRLRNAGRGCFIVSLADWLYPPRKAGAYGSANLPVKDQNQEEEEESSTSSRATDPPPPESDSNHRSQGPDPGGRQAGNPALPPDVSSALIQAGVFSFLLPEVARAGWKEADLLALLAWCQADQPGRPGGLFITRLRGGAVVPARFYREACASCGRIDGHASDCQRRYTSGPFSQFVEH